MEGRRYLSLFALRLALIVLALLVAAWSAHHVVEGPKLWFLAVLFATSATVLQLLPLVVPTAGGKSVVYSLGSAFFLAGMFLLPPSPLVAVVLFSVTLAGLVAGIRPYKIVFQLATSVLAFVGTSLVFHLGPRPEDAASPALERTLVEMLIASGALIALLLLRSVAVRLERGDDSPHWGAFQHEALVESGLCVALAASITLFVRLHVAYLGLVYVQVGATWWFLHRYRAHVRRLDSRGASGRRKLAA